MKRQTLGIAATIVTLSVAGLATGVSAAQPADKMDPAHSQPGRSMTANPVFVSASKIKGMGVENAEKQNLGSIDDMIIDRGSGRIRYIVLKSGSVLGMGGKLVTVPYNSFGWDQADKKVTLTTTKEAIKSWPEFDKKRWTEGTRGEDSFVRTLGKDYYDTTNSPWPTDAAADRPTTLKGTIRSINRHTLTNGQEEMIVIVSTPNSPDREVVLGPSWYMGGNNSISFYRDTPIEVDIFPSTQNGRNVSMARSAKINGQQLDFYDSKGRASWFSGSDKDAFSNAPFVLFTEIKGKSVDCRGEKCGNVENVVVECTAGRAAFLVIDPDKALLGIGDEDRLVPWTVMTRSLDGKVHLDASKTMVTSAPPAPKDLKTLSEDSAYKRIYSSYEVAPAPWDNQRP